MFPKTALLALAAVLTAAPLAAQPMRGEGMRAMFAQELAALDFATLDADADGGITLAEWRSHVTARTQARRAEMVEGRVTALMQGDANGDGALSRDELSTRIAALGDERRADWQERRAERRAERGRHGEHGRGHRGRHHDDDGARGMMGGADDEARQVRSFQRIDRDGDGRITEAELTAAVEWVTERMERRNRG